MTYTQKDLKQARDNGFNEGFQEGCIFVIGTVLFFVFVYVFISIF